MARPSQQLDEELLRVGRIHLEERGCGGLKVRELCAGAGVNLGMFHYHFGTKDAFIGRLLEDIYGPMFARLNLAASGTADPLERLRSTLLVFGGWVRENRRLLARFTADALTGEPAAWTFLRAAEVRHIPVILALIVECQAAGRFLPGSPLEAMIVIGGASFLPLLIGTLIAGVDHLPAPLRLMLEQGGLFAEEALARRIDAALRGLAPFSSASPRPRHEKKNPAHAAH